MPRFVGALVLVALVGSGPSAVWAEESQKEWEGRLNDWWVSTQAPGASCTKPHLREYTDCLDEEWEREVENCVKSAEPDSLVECLKTYTRPHTWTCLHRAAEKARE